jgi:hypothetical protein
MEKRGFTLAGLWPPRAMCRLIKGLVVSPFKLQQVMILMLSFHLEKRESDLLGLLHRI